MKWLIETNGTLFRVVSEEQSSAGLYRQVRGVYDTLDDAKKARDYNTAYDADDEWTKLK